MQHITNTCNNNKQKAVMNLRLEKKMAETLFNPLDLSNYTCM